MKDRLLRLSAACVAIFILLALCMVGTRRLRRAHATAVAQVPQMAAGISSPVVAAPVIETGPTVINVSDIALRENVQRLGVNLGAQSFYDSLQTLKNLIGRNPGFEGMEWQSVLQCGKAGATSCTGGPNSSAWPEGFLDGGSYEVISGAAEGTSGTIVHSSASDDHVGSTIEFSPMTKAPADTDYIAVRKTMPGDASAGWGPQISGGAMVTTEYKDLSPSTPGRQALRINARGPGQSVALKSYFDTTPGRSFVQMRGPYTIRFRAKLLGGNSRLGVSIQRLWAGAGGAIFTQDVALQSQWKDYKFNFTANEPRNAVGPVALSMIVDGAEVLIDDVSVTEATANATAFRADVVEALNRLRPGVLRYMDSGQNFGSSLDNMLAPEDARQRTGFNLFLKQSEDIPLGLNDFLVLCEKVGAEPWYTMQAGWSAKEAAELMEFLGGPVTTKYGATRAALGHPEPWTAKFPMIHLEFGNEEWNTLFPGETISDPIAYAQRATTIFRALRGSQWYVPTRIDLVADGQAENLYLTQTILDKAEGVDTIDIAPYTFNTFDDDSSTEHIFGPMFAEPEMIDSAPNGYVRKQAETAARAKHPAKLAVYEVNIDTVEGKVGQASLNATVPSLGAGLATVEHMLLMLRDDGIVAQSIFQLGGGGFHFNNTAGLDKDERSPVWAMVVDMGGATGRVRPSFLAEELANGAIRPTMLGTAISGSNPTWDQMLSVNDKIELKGAHELQSFAFSDSKTNSLIIFNLSRTAEHSVALAGHCAPQGVVSVKTLTSGKITDSNEDADTVKNVSREVRDVTPGKTTFTLPPFSMTALSSNNQGCMPAGKQSR